MDHLPQAAKDWMNNPQAKKAGMASAVLAKLLEMAWHHEKMEGDKPEMARLARFAVQNNLAHLLPPEAVAIMKQYGISDGQSQPMQKAFNPIAKVGLIVKSWEADDTVYTEGWLSTPSLDLERDITEPEAFMSCIDGYFARRAPLSIEHGTKMIPIGHLQKAAIVRDGQILKSATHPTDPADFEHFPGSGSGVWVRTAINEEPGMSAVRKGNVGGFSFIANGREYEPIPGGRYRYTKLDPWLESTVAAYPVNTDAVIAVAKAYGLNPPPQEVPHMNLEELLQLAAEKVAQEQAKAQQSQPAVKAVTIEDMAQLFSQFESRIEARIDEKVQKALPVRAEGTGRAGVVEAREVDPRDADPAAYIVQKARKREELDQTDKEIAAALTVKALLQGMHNE